MGVATLGRLQQFIDDVLRCRLIRVAHPKIDDVFPARARSGFQLIHNVEDIRWKAFNSGKIVFQGVAACWLSLTRLVSRL